MKSTEIKRVATLPLIIFVFGMLKACGGGGSGSNNYVSPAVDRYALVVNRTDDTVSSYAVDTATGRMKLASSTRIFGTVLAPSPPRPRGIAVHPGGDYVYVTDGDQLYAYELGVDGSLSQISTGLSIPRVDSGWDIVVHPSGRYVYASSETGSGGSITPCCGVYQFTVNANGSLTAMTVPSVAAGISPRVMVMDASGNHLYVVDWAGTTFGLYHFSVQQDGSLAAADCDAATAGLQHCVTGVEPFDVAMSPSGKFLYVANDGDASISQYRVETDGGLTPLGSVSSASNPNGIAIEPNGKYLYASNWSDVVTPYGIGADGLLTRIDCDEAIAGMQSCAAGGNPVYVSVDVTGKYVRVANQTGNTVSQYSIAANGSLVPLAPDEMATRQAPVAIAMTKGSAVRPVNKYTYVANWSSSVSQYNMNPDGTLSPMAIPEVGFGGSSDVIAEPSGRFVYVARFFQWTTAAYRVTGNGELEEVDCDAVLAGIQQCPSGTNPISVTTDPAGRFVYTANFYNGPGGNSVSQYTIKADGSLSLDSVHFAGTKPKTVTVDPSGRYAYVTDTGGRQIFQFSVSSSGSLTLLPTPSLGGFGRPEYVAVHPSGRYAYVADPGWNYIWQLDIKSDGSLTPMTTPWLVAGDYPVSVTLDPRGRYLYVANDNGSTVSQFSINADGSLSPMIIPEVIITSPTSVSVDTTGKYAYVTSDSNDTVTRYEISANGGLLSPVTIAAGSSAWSATIAGSWE